MTSSSLTLEKARKQIAAYGLRLGNIEPLLRRCVRQAPEISAVREELRAKGLYDLADRLRHVETELRMAGGFIGEDVK